MTDIVITKGSTFSQVVRWETVPFIFIPIIAISQAAPAVITAPAHALITGQRAVITGAGGMRQINAKRTPPIPPFGTDWHRVTVVNATQVNFNDVDSSRFTPYTSGGFLASYTPQSLVGYTAKMKIRAAYGAADPALVSLVSPTDIVLDDVNHTITINIAAAATVLYTWTAGVFDLELVSAGGVVTNLMRGNVTVLPGVTL
jgi:hypothetical protein